MLNHKTIGPTANGQYLVAYQTPGCDVPTVATICCTKAQADTEASRLNAYQADREIELRIRHASNMEAFDG